MESNVQFLLDEKPSKGNILVGCTGSVATIKVTQIATILTNEGYNVIIIPTASALHFIKSQAIADGRLNNSDALGGVTNTTDCRQCANNIASEVKRSYPELKFLIDADEWDVWNRRGDPVLHIKLRDWADLLLISPLDANTMAKMACGLCDNLLTCVVRAWDMAKPLAFCPAMNTHMYTHPLTAKHIAILKEFGYIEVPAVIKHLVCGDVGMGAMAEVPDIIKTVLNIITKINYDPKSRHE